MTPATRRVLWWALTAMLVVSILGATAFGGVQMFRHGLPGINAENSQDSRQEVLDVAVSSVPKLLGYTPDNVETTLREARALTTGEFRDSYTELTEETVIPGAKEKRITSVATVPAASVESLTADSALLLVFVDQTVTVPPEEPEETASTVRVGLVRQDDVWLIDQFDPL